MSASSLTQEEQDLLDEAPKALEAGVELLGWWRKADADASYDQRYDETRVPHRPDDTSYGFFDEVELSTGKVRVNGNVQNMFYDAPKAPEGYEETAVEWIDEQVRAFVLKYFMRVSDYRLPEPIAEEHDPPPPGLGFLSQCPEEKEDVAGFGYSQVFSKSRDSEEIERIEEDQEKIVELTRFGEDLEWLVLKNPIFTFGFDFKPFGSEGPQVHIPAKVFNYLVISNDFVVNEVRPEPGIRGRYGFGYALLDDPEPSPYGYGPGRLQPAFEQMIWEVRDSGEIHVRAVFVAQEPEGILHLSVDPFAWGFQFSKALGRDIPDLLRPVKRFWDALPLTNLTFDPVFPSIRLLNFLTLGQAAKRFCISKERILREALFVHFLQHYNAILGSLQTWRQIPDWTADEKDLPDFVVTGRSC